MHPLFQNGDLVLFQGDSITDAGRYRADGAHMGYGYAMQAAAWFHAFFPDLDVRFLNRGVSGDRATDLVARWREDCLELCPTWVSILIGANDTWRRYDSGDVTPARVYEETYRTLLEQVVATLNAHLILCEPFLLPVMPEQVNWREDLDPKIAVVRALAREYHALYVPFDGFFAQAATSREPAFWAADGIHPSDAGHALMAQAWLKTVRAL